MGACFSSSREKNVYLDVSYNENQNDNENIYELQDNLEYCTYHEKTIFYNLDT